MIKFWSVLDRHEASELNQIEAAELPEAADRWPLCRAAQQLGPIPIMVWVSC